MRDFLQFLRETSPVTISFALVLWVLLVGFLVLTGLSDGIWREQDCHRPWRRVEYVVPAYRLGCWLGGVPE